MSRTSKTKPSVRRKKAAKPKTLPATKKPSVNLLAQLPSIDIAIPTMNRLEKCTVCVDSILNGNYENVKVFLLFSDQNELFRYAKQYQHDKRVRCEMTDYSKVSTCWNTFVEYSTADLVLFLCDDTSLEPDCLVNAVKTLKKTFPDGDGLVGLNVTNYPASWPEKITQYGFRLVGKKFHARFPKEAAYCPEYYRFYVDTEMGMYSKLVKRFVYGADAKMQHFHPNAPGGTLDDTHYANRGVKQQWDNEIWKARQEAGLLWGRDLKLVGIR